MSQRFELVIFDCDGVLVDSETLTNRVLVEMAGELDIPLTMEEANRKFIGGYMEATTAELTRRRGKPLPENFVTEFRRRQREMFRTDLRPVPGIEAVLDGLRIPYCVASSGPHEKMRFTMTVTGLLARFEGRIYSGYDVQKWKPDPGLFLYAAEKMGASPARTAVVEDSSKGVQAGVAGGMTVFGYAPENGEDLSAAGARVFRKMMELPALLENR